MRFKRSRLSSYKPINMDITHKPRLPVLPILSNEYFSTPTMQARKNQVMSAMYRSDTISVALKIFATCFMKLRSLQAFLQKV